MVKAVFFDRDGVINKLIQREDKIAPPWKMEEFEYLPNVKKAVDIVKELRYNTFIVTNQPDVLDSKMKGSELTRIMLKIKQDLGIDDYICAYRRSSHLYKPKPGMIVELMNYYSLDKRKCYMIGDTWKDVAAGNSAGVKTIYIGGPITEKDVVPNYYATDILHACELIKELENEAIR